MGFWQDPVGWVKNDIKQHPMDAAFPVIAGPMAAFGFHPLDAVGNKIGLGGGGDQPDYKGAAEATAAANRPNTNTPFSYSNWTKGKDGQYNFTSGLDPSLQGAANQFTAGLQGGPEAYKNAQQAIYGQETSRLDPMWNQRQDQAQSQMVNQGLDPGSEAYRRGMDDFGRSRNDAYQGAMNNSITGGQQAQMHNYQMNMGGLQGLKGLMQPFGFMPGPDYLGAAGMQQQANIQQQKANADAMQGAAQVGTSVAMFA